MGVIIARAVTLYAGGADSGCVVGHPEVIRKRASGKAVGSGNRPLPRNACQANGVIKNRRSGRYRHESLKRLREPRL